jgi:gas vesicle protein
MVKVIVGFLAGVAVGVAAALLLAPSSGEDLRQQMQDYADADMQRMRAEYRRGMDSLQARMDKMSKEVDAVAEVNDEAEEMVDAAANDPEADAA